MSQHKRCAVFGCESTGLRFRTFPLARDRERFLKWLRACGNAELLKLSEKQLRYRVVCDKHFEARVKLATTLSRVAVPTLCLPEPIDVSIYKFGDEETSLDGSILTRNQRTAEVFINDETTNILAELSESDVGGSEEEASEEDPVLDEEETCVSVKSEIVSDNSDPEDNEAINNVNKDIYVGRDAVTIWKKLPYTTSSIVIPPFEKDIKKFKTELSAFLKIIDNDILEHIVVCTNLSMKQKRLSRRIKHNIRDTRETTITELLALIGLLYLAGMKRASYTNLLELWADDGTGLDVCRSTMNYRRFLFLLDCLRFDVKSTRPMRLRNDKLAPIRNIWEKVVENCKNYYTPGESLVIGDSLTRFKGKCNFAQFVPNKPAKSGLKIISLVDAKTSFTCNMELYCGEQPEGPYKVNNDPAATVYRLIERVKGSYRNLTCNEYYTSYALAVSLLEDKITFLGAMRRTHYEVPTCFLTGKGRPVGTTYFGFRNNVTLVSHAVEKNKIVVVLSTAHRNPEINSLTNKPVIVEDYDAIKDAVNVVERTCAKYSVSRRTKRWPLAVFFTLLDVSGVNAQILYNASQRKTQKNRRGFLKNLALSLLKPHLQGKKIKTPFSLRSILHQPDCASCQDESSSTHCPGTEESENDPSRPQCFLCKRHQNANAPTYECDTCLRFTCNEHIARIKCICDECYSKYEVSENDSRTAPRYTCRYVN